MRKIIAAIIAAAALATGGAATATASPLPKHNCLTMGSHKCGPKWTPVPSAVQREIGHTGCLWRIGKTTVIVCRDGYVTTS